MRIQATAVVVTVLVTGAAFTGWRAFAPSKRSDLRAHPATAAFDPIRTLEPIVKPIPHMPDPLATDSLPPLVGGPVGPFPHLGPDGPLAGPPRSPDAPPGLYGPDGDPAFMGLTPNFMREPGGPGFPPVPPGAAPGSPPGPPSPMPLMAPGFGPIGAGAGPDPSGMVMPNPTPAPPGIR